LIGSDNINKNAKTVVLLIATTSSFLTPFMISAINIALPSIQKAFSADAVLLSWIATSFLLSTAVFLVPFGKIADIYGYILIYRWGMIIFTAVSLISAFSPNIQILILLRVLQGIGGSMILTTGMALLTTTYPPQERGKVLGITVSAVYIGLSMGPFIGGFLTQNFGWRSIFICIVPLGLIALFLIFRFLRFEQKPLNEDKLDVPGSLIYGVTLILLVYGAGRLPQVSGIILLICAIPGFILFVRRQLSIPNPVFEVKLFKNNRVFAFSNTAALINYAATNAVTFLLSLYLQYIKELTPQQAGLILIIQPIIMAVLSPYAGKLSDNKEPAVISSMGMACTAIGLFILTFLDGETSNLFIYLALPVLGLGFALFSAPNTNAIMSSVEKKYYGIASASVSTMRLLGQMLSMAIATVIISIFIGKNQITPEYYSVFLQSIHLTFIIFTVLSVAGIYFSWCRGKMHDSI